MWVCFINPTFPTHNFQLLAILQIQIRLNGVSKTDSFVQIILIVNWFMNLIIYLEPFITLLYQLNVFELQIPSYE